MELKISSEKAKRINKQTYRKEERKISQKEAKT